MDYGPEKSWTSFGSYPEHVLDGLTENAGRENAGYAISSLGPTYSASGHYNFAQLP